MSRLHIDNLDTKILQMLVDNGRKPFLEIARECGVSGACLLYTSDAADER